jgi:hypothetical protein
MTDSKDAKDAKGKDSAAEAKSKDSAAENKPKGGGKSPTARKQEQRRQEKLDLVQQQIEEGSLTIRQMTPEERKKYPPRPRKPRKKR